MGDTLRLTGTRSATSIIVSAPALLHALRARCPGDGAPYLNQARDTCPGGVSELDTALKVLDPPEGDLEVGEMMVFVEGTAHLPHPSQRGVRRHQADPPPPRRCVRGVPHESPIGVLYSHQPRTRPAARPARTCPPGSRGPGVTPTEGGSSGKSARVPSCSSTLP